MAVGVDEDGEPACVGHQVKGKMTVESIEPAPSTQVVYEPTCSAQPGADISSGGKSNAWKDTFLNYGEVAHDRQAEIIRTLGNEKVQAIPDAEKLAEALLRQMSQAGLVRAGNSGTGERSSGEIQWP
jgi:hydroxymethylpyrimidine/phosphomethylpyrimidine kinase